jgi:hypothetical protein
MSELDQDRNASRSSESRGVWSLAAFSAAVFMCSVLGAKILSHMVDTGELVQMASDRSLRILAKNVPTPEARQVYSVVRSVGVDGVTTATIPLVGPAPVSPCGDDKGQIKSEAKPRK